MIFKRDSTYQQIRKPFSEVCGSIHGNIGNICNQIYSRRPMPLNLKFGHSMPHSLSSFDLKHYLQTHPLRR